MTIEKVTNFFFKQYGKLIPVIGKIGDTILNTAHKNKIDLVGACEGNLACSTCQVYADKRLFKFSQPSDREYDMLDQAYDVRDNSRLACQIKIDEKIKDMVFEIPKATRNFAVDGFVPKPH
ncbi:Adrenodoxin like protein [Dictyocoela muelleri]|nr:Adrenodoxin like protein [Dictyocoela muelleri]